MLNAAEQAPPADALRVITYDDERVAHDMANGRMNTEEGQILANIASAVRRGHSQWRSGPLRHERVVLVGSGPSLNDPDVQRELREAIWNGAILVTMNGGYHWCLDHGFQPRTQIVMDARPSNARFVDPPVPKCNYVLASQCDPAVWHAVEGREHVWIFHPVVKKEGAASDLLDRTYAGNWIGIAGGTTVATRAISLLRTAGYLRFDLFGIDCCWRGETHHALPQPENARDRAVTVTAGAIDRPETMREFRVSHWQLKQAEDLLTMMKVNGQHFTLTPHGDGMFTHLVQALGSDFDALTLTTKE